MHAYVRVCSFSRMYFCEQARQSGCSSCGQIGHVRIKACWWGAEHCRVHRAWAATSCLSTHVRTHTHVHTHTRLVLPHLVTRRQVLLLSFFNQKVLANPAKSAREKGLCALQPSRHMRVAGHECSRSSQYLGGCNLGGLRQVFTVYHLQHESFIKKAQQASAMGTLASVHRDISL